jgi:RNA polymerase sigma-70 factor (ECF subfamily)
MSPGTNSQSGLSYPIEDTGAGMPRPDADAALVSSAQRGDLNAFEALVRRHQKQMLNIAFRMVDDYDEACEIVQDAFVAAYKNIKTFRREAKFTTWLTTITLNLSKNRLKQIKSRQRNIAFSLDDMVRTGDGQVAIDPPSKEPSVLDSMEKQDIRTKVQDCIKALEPDFREVLVLRDMQDFPYEDIAGMLKIRSGTVKSRLFRAREMVRDCLKRVKGAL